MSENRHQLLRLTEYAAVSTSILGAIAAILTRQLAYAVAPLSISLALNLANRSRQAQSIEQHLTQKITQFDQRLDRVSQHSKILQQNLNKLTQPDNPQIADPEISDTNPEILQVLNNDINPRIQTLSDGMQLIRNQLRQQGQELSTFVNLSTFETLTAKLHQIQISLNDISAQTEANLERRLQALAQTQQQQSYEEQAALADKLSNLEDEDAQVRNDLTHLQQNLDNLPNLEPQLQIITQVQQQSIEKQANLANSLSALENNTNQFLSDLNHLKTDVAQFHSDLIDLKQTLKNLPNFEPRLQVLAQTQQQSNEQQTNLTSNVSGLENSIIQLRSDLAHLRQELEGLIAQVREPSTIPENEPINGFSHIIPRLPEEENYDLEINLGIDFGTGFTKVCFRDLARDFSEIVTFADSETVQNSLSLDQTLIPTKLAILQDGTLLTGLTVSEWQASDLPILQTVDFIKMRLAHLDLPFDSAWRLEQLSELDNPETVESLCIYYLSKIISRAQQWIQNNRSDLFSNQTVRWSVNVGVPVEHCDSPALDRFRRVLSLAWILNCTPLETTPLTISTLNQLIAHLQQWMTENSTENLDCHTTPEIAAAVWSFLSSREAQDGFYTFFDIGDGTLDGAAFRFWREDEGDLRVDFYSGKVQPLGVTAFVRQAAAELNCSSESILQLLIDTPDHDLYNRMQGSNVRRAVQKLIASVVIQGNKQHQNSRHIFVNDDLGSHLKVFVGGGGGNTSFFKSAIQSTHSDFQHGNAGIPPYQIKQIPPPKDLLINGLDPNDFNRFAVAYGLCIPDWEGPEIRLPSQIENDTPPTSHHWTSQPTSYEDTGDLM